MCTKKTKREENDLFIIEISRDRELAVCCVCIDDNPLFDSLAFVCVRAPRTRYSTICSHSYTCTHAHMHTLTFTWAHRTLVRSDIYSHQLNECAILGTPNSTTILCCMSHFLRLSLSRSRSRSVSLSLHTISHLIKWKLFQLLTEPTKK